MIKLGDKDKFKWLKQIWKEYFVTDPGKDRWPNECIDCNKTDCENCYINLK